MSTTKSRRRRCCAVTITMVMLVAAGVLLSYLPASAMDFCELDSLGRVIPAGAQGKLKYNSAGPSFDFKFNASGLDSDTNYSLIRSREPDVLLPHRFEIIASGTSDATGNLEIRGSYKFNMDLIAAKLLLVPTAQTPDKPITYTGKYLFGQRLLSYDDTTTRLAGGGNQSPGPSGWDGLGLQVGEKAVDFTLYGIVGGPGALTPGNQEQPLTEVNLFQLLEEKPVVLITGAFT